MTRALLAILLAACGHAEPPALPESERGTRPAPGDVPVVCIEVIDDHKVPYVCGWGPRGE